MVLRDRAKSKPGEFPMPGDDYVRGIVGFYDAIIEMSPESRAATEWINRNVASMSKDARAKLPALLREMADAMYKAADQARKWQEGELLEAPEKMYIEAGGVELRDILNAFIADTIHRPLKDRTSLVGRAFLIAAIASFEVLFAGVARTIYQHNPAALQQSEYKFTLEELTQYSTIEEAREALVTRRIEALLLESVDGWSKWLERTVNLEFSGIIGEWQVLREVFARRNIQVHADGKVTKRYLQVLSNSSIDISGLEVGQELKISRAYLEDALERLLALGILFTFRVWSRIYKSELNQSSAWVESNQSFLIRNNMWTATQLISDQFRSVKCGRSISLAIQINGWLAQKTSQGIDSIRTEVGEWDISGLAHRYDMIKSLLLGEMEAAQPKVSREIRDGRLSQFEIATHPLFIEYREYAGSHQNTTSGIAAIPGSVESSRTEELDDRDVPGD